MNIGVRPTFDGETKTLEVNIFDFNQFFYEKRYNSLLRLHSG
ncbi:MAG: hypothetical protein JJ971_09675 [Balneolaceae bacterium]|nr:hypothetical protein [Balneolaceae bacterium]MBO6546485.1 hypothetical protein [Balneolaceae bacterium]MBO6648844.1 hypothetical protein [Balneolaceae bacterium]